MAKQIVGLATLHPAQIDTSPVTHGPTSILSANATQTVNVRERTDSAFFRT